MASKLTSKNIFLNQAGKHDGRNISLKDHIRTFRISHRNCQPSLLTKGQRYQQDATVSVSTRSRLGQSSSGTGLKAEVGLWAVGAMAGQQDHALH